jgi:hypothetical protein
MQKRPYRNIYRCAIKYWGPHGFTFVEFHYRGNKELIKKEIIKEFESLPSYVKNQLEPEIHEGPVDLKEKIVGIFLEPLKVQTI